MSSEETQEVAIVKVPYLAPLAPFTTGISIEERFNSFHRANPQVYLADLSAGVVTLVPTGEAA